jgi:hypothetical protein
MIFNNILIWLDAFLQNENIMQTVNYEIIKDIKVLLSRTIVSNENVLELQV